MASCLSAALSYIRPLSTDSSRLTLSNCSSKTISHSLLQISLLHTIFLKFLHSPFNSSSISISKCSPQSPSQSPPLHSPLLDQIPPLISPPSISVFAASGARPSDFHPSGALIPTDFTSPLAPLPGGKSLLLSPAMEVPPNLTTICSLLEPVLVAMEQRFMLLRRSVKKLWLLVSFIS